MELTDAIRNRRAVREYTDQTIRRSEIEGIIDAAIQAPSAMNQQPWAFAVEMNRAKVEDYGNRAKTWLLANLSRDSFGEHARRMLEDPAFMIFYHAPALVLVLAKSSDSQATEDACLAAQNLMLAARDRGLGTCWIGFARPWLNLPATRKELGLPAQYEVVAPIIVGYPKAWPASHGRNPAEVYWLK